MDNQFNKPYTYMDSGFNRFFSRSIGGANKSPTLSSLASSASQQARTVNYDQQSVSGALGDNLTIGNITLDGSVGRISISDDGQEIVRIGDMGNVSS